LSIPDEGYSRSASCALNVMSTFIFVHALQLKNGEINLVLCVQTSLLSGMMGNGTLFLQLHVAKLLQ
jgi:hypothetical protein